MNISRFFGATNREALRQVRLALGPDALIVSNRRVNGGVEILATDATSAPDNDATSQAPVIATPDRAATNRPGASPIASALAAQSAAIRPRPPAAPATSVPPHRPAPPADVLNAIEDMRGALETRIDELLWGRQAGHTPHAIALFQTLLGLGFSTVLLRAMLQRLPEHLSGKAAFQWARSELISHLPVLKSEDELWTRGGAIALVGPTGVGKTTTIAKLAARCVKRFGAENVVLITTDTYRIGAHEQLNIYGQIMRVPVHVVRNAAELARIVDGLSPAQMVLIDNVGVSQRDRYVAEQAALLAGTGRPIRRLLVLNASSHGDTLDEVARSYANDGGSRLHGCIITKVDEATRLGAALDTAIRYRLPIQYVSNGQKVPENLLFLDAIALVDRALTPPAQSKALYAPTGADLAAMMSHARGVQEASQIAPQRADRKAALSGLLTMVGNGRSDIAEQDIEQACACLDESIVGLKAYELWRMCAGYEPKASVDALARQLLSAACIEAAENSEQHLLALHDQASFKSGPGAGGRMRASLLSTSDGTVLTSPLQQLTGPEGWLSTCGMSASEAPAVAEALMRQVQWLAEQSNGMPLVHVFNGGNAALWHMLSSADISWQACVTGATAIDIDDGATTVAALCKTLAYRPVDGLPQLLRIGQLMGCPLGELAVWCSVREGTVRMRSRDALAVRVATVRLVSRHDGAVLKTLYGLCPQTDPASDDQLAIRLLLQAEHKASYRLAAALWKGLSQSGVAQQSQFHALASMQMGLAAWHLGQSQMTQAARHLIPALSGDRKPSVASHATSLMKLFALKELMR